jgi:hypothetical protein
VDGLHKAIMEANPHLDGGRDDQAVRRLAWCYKLTTDMHKDMTKRPPTYTAKAARLDEYHKLYADALRLEQELGITPAARARQGMGSDGATGVGLGGIKG